MPFVDLNLETSALTDGTQWEVCEADAGDAVASIVEGPHAGDIATLFAAAPTLLRALLAAMPHISDPAVHAQAVAAVNAAKL